uniref:PUL domain-containing protein n=1 Tax=Steinernema glaseri TaxID=37863 RepID=A0A1I8AHD5_9BILA
MFLVNISRAPLNNAALRPSSEHYPPRKFILFEQYPVKPEKAVERLRELNSKNPDYKLDRCEFCMCIAAFNNNPITSRDDLYNALVKSIVWWPETDVLPAVDLLCRAVLDFNMNRLIFGSPGDVPELLFIRLKALLLSKGDPKVKFIVIRGFCNAFSHAYGQHVMIAHVADLMNDLMHVYGQSSDSESIQIAIASFIHNSARATTAMYATEDRRTERSAIIRILLSSLNDIVDFDFSFKMSAEAVRYFQIAIITLMWGDKDLVTVAANAGVLTLTEHFSDVFANKDIKEFSGEIRNMVCSVLQ